MKLICDGLDLSDAVLKVSKALSVRSTNPVLEGIKITAVGDTLTLLATDMELTIEKKIKADILMEGETVVVGKYFVEFAKKLEKEQVELCKIEGGQLQIKYSDSQSEGDVLFNESLKDEKESFLREKRLNFGLVFQSFNLFPQYNVFDNIVLASKLLLKDKIKKLKKELKAEKLSSKEIKSKIIEFKKQETDRIEKDGFDLLEKIGLTDKIKSYPCELSGGQQQRVAIARALALKPKVLCFDEPTSALDPELTGEVLKVIRSLKDEDRTMIIVTHEMGFAKHVSDKVVFMANGVIEEEGPPSILDNPKSELLKLFLSNVDEKDNI